MSGHPDRVKVNGDEVFPDVPAATGRNASSFFSDRFLADIFALPMHKEPGQAGARAGT